AVDHRRTNYALATLEIRVHCIFPASHPSASPIGFFARRSPISVRACSGRTTATATSRSRAFYSGRSLCGISLAILSPTRSLQARGPQLGRIHHLVLRALGAGDRHRRMLCACCGQVGAEKPCGGPSTAVPFLRISGGVSCSALPVCSRLLVAFLHAADKL